MRSMSWENVLGELEYSRLCGVGVMEGTGVCINLQQILKRVIRWVGEGRGQVNLAPFLHCQ